MKNLVTLITGGLSSLGFACMKRFVDKLDTHVIICDLSSASSSSLFLLTDVTSALDAASKGVIDEMTRPLSEQLVSMNIRVPAIAPGTFNTPLLRRLCTKVPSTSGKFPLFSARLSDPDEFAQFVQTIVKNPLLNGINIRLDALLHMPP